MTSFICLYNVLKQILNILNAPYLFWIQCIFSNAFLILFLTSRKKWNKLYILLQQNLKSFYVLRIISSKNRLFSDIQVFDEDFRSKAAKKGNSLNKYAQFLEYQHGWDTRHNCGVRQAMEFKEFKLIFMNFGIFYIF